MVRVRDLADLARRRPVVRNAAALALAGGAARLFDAAYRVVIARYVGPETVGLLQMAGSVYAFALGLATLGVTPALAQLIAFETAAVPGSDSPLAKRLAARTARAAVVTARALALPAAMLSALLLLASGPWISRHVLADPRSLPALRALAAGLVPAGLCAVLRGRFQGVQRVAPLAGAQILEPLARLSLALAALFAFPALWSVPVPLPPAALLALVSVLGEGVECLVLSVWDAREEAPRPEAPRFSPALAGRLLRAGIPIMLGQFLFSAVAVADASLIPRLLVAGGLTPAQATREYGLLHGMVLPFLFFPMTLVFPLGAVLIPAVSEAQAARDRRRLRRRLRLAVWATVAVEAGAALSYLAAPGRLAALVGGGARVAGLIRGLAVWAPFAYLDYIGASALIGLGSTRGALEDGLLNAAVRLGLACFLVPCPELGVKGALLSLAAGDAVATGAHFYRLGRALNGGRGSAGKRCRTPRSPERQLPVREPASGASGLRAPRRRPSR